MALPYLNAYGLVTKIFDKIIAASQPERFTQDFLATKLGYDSGSARPIIPLLKRLGFLASDGTPTSLYSKFRNPDPTIRGMAMAQALKTAYKEVFERNEYAHELTKDKFKHLIIEMTGAEPADPIVNNIVNTFFNLKNYAKFEMDISRDTRDDQKPQVTVLQKEEESPLPPNHRNPSGLNLAYTIYLNLPETTDIEVFNAIFMSLKENLLKA